MSLSIRARMMLAIAAPVLVVYLLMYWLMVRGLEERAVKELEMRSVHMVENLAGRFDGNLQTVAQVARSTAAFLTLNPETPEETLYRMLDTNVRQNPLIYGSCIAFEPYRFDSSRQLVAPYVYRGEESLLQMDVAVQAYDYTDSVWEWYRVPREGGEPIWTEPFFDEGAGDILMCTHSAPFFEQGEFRGVATIDIPLAELQRRSGVADLQRESFFILARSGAIVSAPDPSLIMHSTIFEFANDRARPELEEVGREMLAGKSGIRRVPSWETGEPIWLVYSPIESSSWSLAVMLPESRATEFLRNQFLRASIGLALTLVIILVCIWLVSAHLTVPIRRLAHFARQVGGGDLDLPSVHVKQRDEIGALATAFNSMVQNLRTHVQALTQETSAREAVESELRVAREIQASLLPRNCPVFPGRSQFELHAVNVPARQVAGDFYDYYLVDGQTLVLLIADVSGKGVPAALFMAVARTVFRNLVNEAFSPAEVFNRANRSLYDDNVGSMFVTVFLAYFDLRSGGVTYANAGHHRPLRVARDGRITMFGESTGTILGILPDATFTQEDDILEPGDRLVLYTDGVPDARNLEVGTYGMERLIEALHQHASDTTEQLCTAVAKDVALFEGPNRQDDVTIVILRRIV